MKDPSVTNHELLLENSRLRERIEELQRSEDARKATDEGLALSMRRLQLLIDAGPDFFFLKDLDLRYQIVNTANADFFGREKADILGKSDMDLLAPDAAIACGESDRQAILQKKTVVTVEPVGGRFYETYKFPVFDEGEVVGVAGIVRDITERKRTEDMLRYVQARYRLLFEHSPDGIVIADPFTARIVEFNETAHRQLGYSREEFARLSIPDVEAVESRQETLRHIEKVISEGRDDFETRHRTREGHLRNIHVTAQMTEISGQAVFHCVWRDITSQKRAEEALKASESRLAAIIEFLPDATFAIDLDGKIITWNKAIEEMTGSPAEEMIGKGDYEYALPFYGERCPILVDFLSHWDDDAVRKYSLIEKMGDTLYMETDIPLVRGQNRTLWGKASPLRNEKGDVIGAIESIRDVTDYRKAEKALKEREKTLQAFFDAVQEGMLLTDREGIVILINTVSARRMGGAVAELVGTPLYDQLPQDLALHRKEQHENVLATGEPVYFEDSRSGRFFGHYYYPVFDEKGKVSAIAIFARDITDRKRWLETLEESEERYRTVVEHSRDGIAIIGEGVHIYVNQRFLGMFGFESAEEVIGKPHSLTVHPDDLERVIEINKRRQAGEIVPLTYEFKGIRKNGSVIFVDVSATRIMYRGSYDSLVFLRDVTERKLAEEALRKSEQTLQTERDKLRTISENAPFGFILVDHNDRFAYINPKFTELFGFDLADIPDSRTWFRKAYPDEEYRHAVISTWLEDQSQVKEGPLKPRIFTVTCKDRTQKIVNFVSSVLASGGYLMACEDITDLKRLESQLLQAQKMEAVGTLAGGIAHDFNNILTAIIGYASLLQMNMIKTNPLRLYVDPILSATRKAADLTQNLLAFSRRQPVTLVPLDVNNTIRTTKKLLERLLTEDIELHTRYTADETIVMADKTQMDQILFNLVTNARDAMPKGGTLTIETRTIVPDGESAGTYGLEESGQYVLVTVSDTGTGMDEETKEHIFDPFFTTKEVGKGTGLGLATVYGIVKQHGGYISVDSKPNQGTSFQIYLPTIKTAEAAIHQEEQQGLSTRGGREKILIAEDNDEVRRFVVELLKQYGYRTIGAVDGEDAVFKFRQNQDADLIIVDSVMPKKNGREVYEEIRRIRPEIKALFTSGYTKDIVLDKGIGDKEFDFIAKPLSPLSLLRKVREMLDR